MKQKLIQSRSIVNSNEVGSEDFETKNLRSVSTNEKLPQRTSSNHEYTDADKTVGQTLLGDSQKDL